MSHVDTYHLDLISSRPDTIASTLSSTQHATLPPLPPHLIPSILPYLLPPSPPLPTNLLTPLFRQTLLYLQPDTSEMDRQLSAFPLPITTEALQRRLEELSRGYELGKVGYGWDGECGVARVGVKGEYGGDTDEGMDMYFQCHQEEGWGYHGLRIPEKEGETGIQWTSDPSSINISPLSTDHSSLPSSSNFETTGSLDPYTYSSTDPTTVSTEGEIADYWAGFSPPSSPKLDARADGATGMDEEERERQYWAQYSNAPSAAVSPAISRKASMMDTPPPAEPPAQGESDIISGSSGVGRSETPLGRTRTGTILANLNTSHPSTSTSDVTPQTAHPKSPPITGSQDISLLRDRLRMKTLSLLRRCWTNYLHSSSGFGGQEGELGQGEKESKGLRWLSLGREITSKSKNNGAMDGPDESQERKVKATMEILWEMYEVYSPTSAMDEREQEGRDTFYRLIEQALSQESGDPTGGEGTRGGGDGGGLHRNYSFEQQAYWE